MVVDCFTFFNELDLLEIRLHTLNDVVDRFVLVEATLTHQGKKKPLYFKENADRFERFLPKITHLIVDDYPTFWSLGHNPRSWDLERHQRKQMAKGLVDCKPQDVIIVSDIDEIPNPGKIKAHKTQPGIKVFEHKNFSYYLNCKSSDRSELYLSGSVMAFYNEFSSTQDLRMLSIKLRGANAKLVYNKTFLFFKAITHPIFFKPISIIANAGWHFSYLGGEDHIVQKLEAFAHDEFNKEEYKNKTAILDAINTGKDLFHRGVVYEYIAMDDTYPPYILNNILRFQHLIKNMPPADNRPA